MPTLTINPAELPTTQFTAGSLLKQFTGSKLAEVRAALDKLVDAGTLTVKVAGSGARNYKRAGSRRAGKASKATEKTTTAPAAAPTDAEWETTPHPNQGERIKLAKAEAAALKAWQKLPKAKQGPRPSTVNLDALDPNTAKGKVGRKAGGSSTPRGTTVQFYVDGRAMPASQNKLSSVAWYHTKGIGGDAVARIDVKALRSLFEKAGVADPSNTVGVDVTLPNGKRVTTKRL